MKKLIPYIFFFPLFFYLLIIILNTDLLVSKSDINIFWIFHIREFPFISLTTLFFSLYIIIIWGLLKFSDIFFHIKNKKLEEELNKTKAKLQEGQEANFQVVIESIQKENKQAQEKNEIILSQIKEELKIIKEKL
ncbi:hypothetical protein HGA92_00500 [Candidatus Gracilibacteria bacterium]|nr:hypothetical protein [Candidatus Gracilibacteria bacterium]NUJ98911.1 hypothetical protein [Candidatus Gracilibacteria bacterium]